MPNPGLSGLLAADQAEQTSPLITYIENDVTNAIESTDDAPHAAAMRGAHLRADRLRQIRGRRASRLHACATTSSSQTVNASSTVLRHKSSPRGSPYEATPPSRCAVAGARSSMVRTLYRARRPDRPVAVGRAESLALPGESYKLAFTPGLLTQVFNVARKARPIRTAASRSATVLGGQAGHQGGYRAEPGAQSRRPLPRDRCRRPLVDSVRPVVLQRAAPPTPQPRAGASPAGTSSCRAATATRSARTPSSTSTRNDLLMAETRDALGNRVTVDGQRLPRAAAAPGRATPTATARSRLRRAGHGGRHGGDGQAAGRTGRRRLARRTSTPT